MREKKKLTGMVIERFAVHRPDKADVVSDAAEMAFVGICAVLVSYHVSRMTRTVLNAIELLRK